MKWSRLICLAALASQLVASGAAADRAAATPDDNSGTAKVPPVLRPSEPRDSWQVTLPGPPPGAPAPGKKVSFTLPSPAPVAPVAKPAPTPAKPVPDATPRRSLPLLVPAAQAKPSPPSLQIGREVAGDFAFPEILIRRHLRAPRKVLALWQHPQVHRGIVAA